MPWPRQLLVVDDDANTRTALGELLRDEGFAVETAASGLDALAKLATTAPQIVIADLDMPGMAGLELVRALRAGERPPAVIVLTAFGEIGPAIAALRAGASDYLIKPLHFDELLLVLDKVLCHYDLEREVERLRERLKRAERGRGQRAVET